MTDADLHALGLQLTAYLRRFHSCFVQQRITDHLHTYCRGLLSDLPRKSVEPLALAAGTPVRTLQEFLRDYTWEAAAIRDQLHAQVADLLLRQPADDLGTVGFLDETSTVKSGTHTPGVQRQYLGCVGKVQNGIVTVHLGVCRGCYQTLADADLYLPESWSADRPRCRAAGIPDDVVYRPKWQIALEQLDRLGSHGIALDWLTFDADYGKRPGFLAGLQQRRQRFVGEVSRTLACLAAHRSGRPPAADTPSRPAEEVVRTAWRFRDQPWQVVRLSRSTDADQVWRVKAARVWLSSVAGWSAATAWLIWASNDGTGEEKFFLSNAAAETPVAVLVRVAFRRARVEHCFRVCKSELGFSHFEGRNYGALLRHLSLCLLTLNFVAEHTERLRGEKSGGDGGAGVPRVGDVVPRLAASASRDERDGERATGHRLSPRAQSRGSQGATPKTGHRSYPQEASAPPPQATKPINEFFQVALYC